MCELISDICDRGEMWEPSEDFIAEHPEVFYLVAHRDSLSELTRRRRIELRRLRISQLRRMARCADLLVDRLLDEEHDGCEFSWRWFGRVIKFRDACLAEIERLRALS